MRTKEYITNHLKLKRKSQQFLSNILNPYPTGDAPCVTPFEEITQKLKRKEGKEIYKKGKQTFEPIFGVIKEILGFRRFSLREEAETDAEWSLVCSAYNLKRFFKMQMA